MTRDRNDVATLVAARTAKPVQHILQVVRIDRPDQEKDSHSPPYSGAAYPRADDHKRSCS